MQNRHKVRKVVYSEGNTFKIEERRKTNSSEIRVMPVIGEIKYYIFCEQVDNITNKNTDHGWNLIMAGPRQQPLTRARKLPSYLTSSTFSTLQLGGVIVMTFWYVFWNGLNFFKLFKLYSSLGIDHDPPRSLCSHDLCLFLFFCFILHMVIWPREVIIVL